MAKESFTKTGRNAKCCDHKLTITHSGTLADVTCYGSVIIESHKSLTHKWRFKIKQLTNGKRGLLHIGIDEASCRWTNGEFYYQYQTVHYSFKANGTKWTKKKTFKLWTII
eukprot:180631_1